MNKTTLISVTIAALGLLVGVAIAGYMGPVAVAEPA